MTRYWPSWTTLSLTASLAALMAVPVPAQAEPLLLAQATDTEEAAPAPFTTDSTNGGTFDSGASSGDVEFSEAEASPEPAEPEVLVAEVLVTGTDDPELIQEIYRSIATQAGRTTTRTQLESDINSVFSTGYFSDVEAVPSDTALGVRVTYEVRPNPIIQSVDALNTSVLPEGFVEEVFQPQIGQVLNYGELQAGVEQIEAWYAENGFVLATVKDVSSSRDGAVEIDIAEGVVEDIRVAGNDYTRDFIVTREMELEPGEVFNRDTIQEDLRRVFDLNLFADVNLSLAPGDDPDQVVATVNVEEQNTGSLSAGGGLSSDSGIFGTLSVSQNNFGGNNQRVGLDIQVGTEELLFDAGFTDPRIAHWETPTSLNVNAFNRISSDRVYDDDQDVVRLGGTATLARPIGGNWRANLGVQQQFVSINDRDDDEPLTLDGDTNTITGPRLGVVRDTRDNPITPSQGSVFRASTDQSVAGFVFDDGLNRNRVEVSYSYFIPVDFIGLEGRSPEALAFDVRTGTLFGDTAPFDSFLLGGASTIRGFDEGRVGTSQSFALASAEYRFPVFDFVGGVLFADYGTDLGRSDQVFGNPTSAQDLLGSAFGVGAGLRIQSPLGAVRVDYAIGQGEDDGRLHFGFGEKF